jgi:hypothetical protein
MANLLRRLKIKEISHVGATLMSGKFLVQDVAEPRRNGRGQALPAKSARAS